MLMLMILLLIKFCYFMVLTCKMLNNNPHDKLYKYGRNFPALLCLMYFPKKLVTKLHLRFMYSYNRVCKFELTSKDSHRIEKFCITLYLVDNSRSFSVIFAFRHTIFTQITPSNLIIQL